MISDYNYESHFRFRIRGTARIGLSCENLGVGSNHAIGDQIKRLHSVESCLILASAEYFSP